MNEINLASSKQKDLNYGGIYNLNPDFDPYTVQFVSFNRLVGGEFKTMTGHEGITTGSITLDQVDHERSTHAAYFNSARFRLPFISEYVIGTQDYTVEAFVNAPDFFSIAAMGAGVGTANYPWFYILTAGAQMRVFDYAANATLYTTQANSFTRGVFSHMAYCRHGTMNEAYVNGVRVGGVSGIRRNYSVADRSSISIGSRGDGANLSTGWIFGFRVTIGACRYTENFDISTI